MTSLCGSVVRTRLAERDEIPVQVTMNFLIKFCASDAWLHGIRDTLTDFRTTGRLRRWFAGVTGLPGCLPGAIANEFRYEIPLNRRLGWHLPAEWDGPVDAWMRHALLYTAVPSSSTAFLLQWRTFCSPDICPRTWQRQKKCSSSKVNHWVSNKCIAVHKVATPLRELTCHMESHSVTCHPAEVTFPPLPQPKLVLD